MALGAILPIAWGCPTCRVIFPAGVSFVVWIPPATEPLLAIGAALFLGIRLATRDVHGRYLMGFLTAVGLFAIARFLPLGVHARFPTGDTFGLGGIVGMVGGALVLTSGLLMTAGTASSGRGEQERDRSHGNEHELGPRD
jgi:hypothetical protein